MIPETPDNILETNTVGKKIKFTFHANRHLFDAFSKNLYSNPHDSVVREIISNAIDAQVRAGTNDKPLTIILNNEFIVQDNGTGMTPNVIENIYSVYGNSDKRETNDEIGMYGFGAKSCFAIADQFVVETVPGDGYKYMWVIYKDLSGSGEINLTSQVETDEPTGTKVRVPIKNTDYNSIKTAIVKYINFIKPWPVTHFSSNFMAQQPQIVFESDDYLEVKQNVIGKYNILYDGWMPYCVNGVQMPPNVFIKIEKGKLRLSASRENITITDSLKDIVDLKLKKYWENTEKEAKEKIHQSTNPIEIIEIANILIGRYNNLFNRNITINIEKHPIYGGFKWPETFCYYRLYKRSYSGRIIDDCSIHINKQLKFAYIDEQNLEKLNSPYYKTKIRHMLASGAGQVVVLRDKDLQQKTLPLFKPLFDSAVDIVKYKVPRATSSSSTPRKYEKNTIAASLFDGQKYTDTRVKYKEGVYVYGLKNYEINTLPHDKSINFCVVSRRVLNKIKQLDNWMTVKDYIEKKAAKFTEDDIKLFQINQTLRYCRSFVRSLFDKKMIDVEKVNADNINKISKDDLCILSLAADFGFIKLNDSIDNEKILKSITKEYPLLAYIHDYKIDIDKKSIKYVEEYVQMIQEKKQCQTSA